MVNTVDWQHRGPLRRRILRAAPIALFAVLICAVGFRSERFLTGENAAQIVSQAAPTVVVAVGMTFVLLTGGVDLSVGAVMFIAAGLAGRLSLAGWPLGVCSAVMLGTGLAAGLVNSALVTRFKLIPFVATLATLYVGRGVGRWVTETRAINLPESFFALGAGSWFGIPIVAWVAGVVAIAGQVVLSSTPLGRQIYALGANPEAARKAGVNITRVTAAVYAISGLCAGIGGLLALSRLGAVSPRFGELYEFDAITATVLGGTSLYGGHGRVLPGAVVGALLLKGIFSALVSIDANPYLYPLITATIIFAAVLVDTLRARLG